MTPQETSTDTAAPVAAAMNGETEAMNGSSASGGDIDLLGFGDTSTEPATTADSTAADPFDLLSNGLDHHPPSSSGVAPNTAQADFLDLMAPPPASEVDSDEVDAQLDLFPAPSNMDTAKGETNGSESIASINPQLNSSNIDEGKEASEEKKNETEASAPDEKTQTATEENSEPATQNTTPSEAQATENDRSDADEGGSTHEEIAGQAPTEKNENSQNMEQDEADAQLARQQTAEVELSPDETIAQLESELRQAKELIASLQARQDKNSTDDDVLSALQDNLQQQMTGRAEAENKLRMAEAKIANLEDETSKQTVNLESLQENLEQQMTARAEAEHKARSAYDRVQQLEAEKEENVSDLKDLQQKVYQLQQEKASQETELEKVRLDRDEQERKAMALTAALNLAKKKEAVKLNLAEEFEEDLKITMDELEDVRSELERTASEKASIERRLDAAEAALKERVDHFESALQEERRLNEERKAKMKAFVEKKVEELRQSKEENDSVQMELAQTNRSLVDMNNRWKQLHAQWVQAQTRNRELQRDLNRIKKDSETLHRQGDTLEMKLSRSANETEEHKNKRLAAKQELMSVLRTLDAERDVTAKLRDKIKFSFTPKVLSQHQMLTDILDEFEASLEKLSLRLGKPLPPADEPEEDRAPHAPFRLSSGDGHAELAPLVEKLELESQHVSQAVQSVHNNVGRLRAVIDASGDRTCFTIISELVTTGSVASSPALRDGSETTSITGALRSRSHAYGQVPESADH